MLDTLAPWPGTMLAQVAAGNATTILIFSIPETMHQLCGLFKLHQFKASIVQASSVQGQPSAAMSDMTCSNKRLSVVVIFNFDHT